MIINLKTDKVSIEELFIPNELHSKHYELPGEPPWHFRLSGDRTVYANRFTKETAYDCRGNEYTYFNQDFTGNYCYYFNEDSIELRSINGDVLTHVNDLGIFQMLELTPEGIVTLERYELLLRADMYKKLKQYELAIV